MLDQTPVLPWTQPGWFDEASTWINQQLAQHGWDAAGAIEILHMRPWSAFARIPTAAGTVYFKAPAPALRFEAALTEALHSWQPDCTVPVIAIDRQHGWMLSADGGVTLRSLIQSASDFHHWDRLLPLYADLQINLAPRVPELLALGLPDRRLITLPRLYEQLLADTENLRVGLPQGLSREAHQGLMNLHPRVTELCRELADYNLPQTLMHEEVHDANVIVSGERYIFTDWSDSSVAFPFFTLLVTLRSTAYRLKLAEDAPEMQRLIDAYLEPWTTFESRENLRTAVRIAYRLAMIARSLAYRECLGPLPESYKVENDSIAGWMEDFLDAETSAQERGP